MTNTNLDAAHAALALAIASLAADVGGDKVFIARVLQAATQACESSPSELRRVLAQGALDGRYELARADLAYLYDPSLVRLSATQMGDDTRHFVRRR